MLPLFSFMGGLSFLCGLNLYLATFLVSFSVRQGWVEESLHPALAVLGHPAIMIMALVLFLVEFILDKIPWVDSLWDAVHTVIRPAGAVWLSWVISGAAGFGAGATAAIASAALVIALSTHLTKSGVRLLINASPEPFTNILASLAEDLTVILLLLLLIKAPVTGFVACLALLAGTWIILPRMFRLVKTSLFLLWKKYVSRATYPGLHHGALPAALTVAQETELAALAGADATAAAWAMPCVSGKTRGLAGLRANRFGTLIAPAAHPGILCFLSRGWFHRHAIRISLAGANIRQEIHFLSANLVIHRPEDGLHVVFRFTRVEAPLVARLVQDLHARLGLVAPGPPLPPAPLPPPAGGVPPPPAWNLPPISH